MTSVEAWLERLGLGKYRELFVDSEIDFEVLPDLTDEDLKELGVALGARKKLLRAIAALGPETPETPATGATPDRSGRELPGPAVDAGERRQVTVFFCDLAGFTKLSGELDAEVMHAILNRYFETVDQVIESFGGTVDKHMGDSVMAVFGAPVAHGNDPERAVRAALAIHQAMPALSAEVARSLQVHVGIASGQVVACSTGSDSHREYTVTGDSVNLASRLQDLAAAGETLISDAVYRAVMDLTDCQRMADATIKGFRDPVPVWRVRNMNDDGGSRAKLPLIGRSAQTSQFTSVLETCLEAGVGQAVHIRGPAGIGKTRLGEHLMATAEALGFSCHKGLVLDFGTGVREDAVSVVVNSLLRIPAGAGERERAAAARGALDSGLIAPHREAFLNDLLDVPQPEELRAVYDAMDSAARNQGKRETVAELLQGASRDAPVLVMIEDIHWADEPTLAQLAEMAAATPACPAVLAMTTRVEGDPLDQAWQSSIRHASLLTMDLPPLSPTEATRLAVGFFDADSDLAKTCVRRAEGNPLFLEQLLRSAGERGDAGVPGSVQSLVQARMDSLAESDRRAIQAAAVLGQRFSIEPLRHLSGQPDFDCSGLVAQFLVRPAAGAFMFVHALIRDAVYAALLHARARELHRRAADWFDGVDMVLRAEHLDRAEDPAAPGAYLEAARGLVADYEFHRALQLVERGLQIVRLSEERYRLHCLRAEILRGLGSLPEAVSAFEQALEAAETVIDRCRALIGKAAALRVLGRIDATLETLQLAESVANGAGPELAQIEHYRGNISFLKGDVAGCLEQQKRALRYAEAASSPEQEANALSGLGDAEYMRGRMITAHRYYSRCMETARLHGLGAVEVSNLPPRENTRQFQGDLAVALDNCRSGARAAANVGLHRPELITRIIAAKILFDMCEFDEALAHAEQSASLCRQIGARVWLPMAQIAAAKVRMEYGDREAAVAILEDAVVDCRETSPALIGPGTLGALALVTTDPERRRLALAEADEMLKQSCVGHNQLWFYRDAMEACLRDRDWEAAEHYAAALEAYTASEPLRWSDFFIRRARALAAFGRGDRGDDRMADIAQLRDIAGDVGFRWWIRSLNGALESVGSVA